MIERTRLARSVRLAAALLASASIAIAQPAPRQRAQDDAWPKKIPFGEATIVLDAPQTEKLQGTTLTAHGAFRLERPGEDPQRGTLRYEAQVSVDRGRRVVTMISAAISDVDLPGAAAARRERLAARLSQAVTRRRFRLSFDDVLAQAHAFRAEAARPPKLNNDPPRIVFATEPSILVLFDGEPRFRAVEGSGLERAMNTPFLVVRDPSSGTFYLNGGTRWFRAADAKGPWTPADAVPAEAAKIAAKDLKEGGVSDGDVREAERSADRRVPSILVATEPTELIVSDGPPRWTPILAGELETMGNSESDVFRTPGDGKYWLVVSGRWYASDAYSGPWKWVEPDRLPAPFRRIPSDSGKAGVLAFVPGTAAADEALADATRPRTAAVRRRDAHVDVTYDGDPQFQPIPGTRVEYAVNTPDSVLKIDGRYYVCDQGVWFTASRPTGPWSVADSIPDEDIAAIPPESPVYNTRFAYVYDSTPDTVYVAYTPGYLWSYPYYGAVVFGTGWFYRPWWGAHYYPRFWTWGFRAVYGPWGGWRWGFGWGPAWAAGWRFGFGWGWGARWCGPGAFFRPGIRNVSITRNVSVTRNLYASGANVSRAAAASGASRAGAAASGSRTAAATRGAVSGTSPSSRVSSSGRKGAARSPQTRKVKPGAKGAKPGKAGGGRKKS